MNNKITIPLGLENPHFVLEVEYMPHFGNRALHEKVDIPTRHKEVITELFLQEWKGGKALAYGPGRPRYSVAAFDGCLLYTSPSPRDRQKSRMPSSA